MTSRPYHHGDLHAALVDVATTLVAEHGPHGFSMAEASRRAGVSVAAPYRHFEDREHLLAAVVARAFDEVGDELGGVLEESPDERLVAIAVAYVRVVGGNASRYDLLFASGLDKRLHPDVQRASFAVLDVFVAPARSLVVDDASAVQLATAIGVVAHGYATLHRDGGLGSLDDVLDQVARAVRSLLKGRSELDRSA